MDAIRPNTCVICGMTYATDEVDRDHITYHHKFLASGLRLGYYPEPYEHREKRKRLGHKLVAESSDLNDKVYGALQIIRAWFDRSLDAAISKEYWKEHPSFENFVGMITDYFPPEVQKVIRRRFGCNPGQLDDGNCWMPPGQ